jgi:hypothetical protein
MKILSFSLLFLVLTISSFVSVRAISNALSGDINGDGIVNMKDVVLVAKAFGSRPGDSNWNANADLDGNGIIDKNDLVIVLSNFGQGIPQIIGFTSNLGYFLGWRGLDAPIIINATIENADSCVLSVTVEKTFYNPLISVPWTNLTMIKNGNIYIGTLNSTFVVYGGNAYFKFYAQNKYGQTESATYYFYSWIDP